MSKLLLLLFLFISAEELAQPGDSLKKNLINHQLNFSDSILVKTEKLKDSELKALPASDSMMIKENTDRNVSDLSDLQKKQRIKGKKGAMIRIGTGIAFLIILIIGLRRKVAKNRRDVSASG